MKARMTLIVILVGLSGFIAVASEWTSSATSTVSHTPHTEQSMVQSKQTHLFEHLESLMPEFRLRPPSRIQQEPSPELTPLGVARTLADATNTSVVPEAANMTYHGGPVQHTQRIFTIFWSPSGFSFPTGFQSTINQFVQDLNGSSYYGIASQYTDTTGNINTTVLYGGTWLDTTNAFPKTSLSPSDLLAEVNRAQATNGWTSDGNSYFQVYTPSGIVNSATGICGVHYGNNPAFGHILFPQSTSSGTCFPGGTYPNGSFVDAAINTSAHEIMETVTDPLGNAWYYQDHQGEIGDLCNFDFGSARASDGSNVTLNGHPYLIQREWSNSDGGCMLSSNGGCVSGTSTLRNIDGGPPIHPPGSVIKVSSDPTVYLIDTDNRKRPISNSSVLAQLYNQSTDARSSTNFSNWVVTVGQDELDLYELGGNISAALPGNGQQFPDGKLIGFNGEVSMVTGVGKRRPFASSSTLTGLGYSFCQVVNVSQSEYNSYLPGAPVDAMALLTSSVNLSPTGPYIVGQNITGTFTIRNVGFAAFPFSSLGIGGRLNGTDVYDISFVSTTVGSGSSYTFNSQPKQLSTAGTYDFFAAYQEGNAHWAISVPANLGVVRSRQVNITTSGCTYTLSPGSQSFGASGGNGSFGVATSAGCTWTAVSNASWVTTTSSGSGNGTVNFAVAANTGAARTGTITVSGQTFTVSQAAAGGGCPSTTISLGQTINGTLTTSDCIFTGTTRYVDVYNFSGTAGQQIVVAMNSSIFDTYLYLLDGSNQFIGQDDDGGGGTNSRIPATSGGFTLPATGTFTIYATSFSADGTTGSTGAYSISLSSGSCNYALSPSSQSFGSSGGSGSFAVTTSSGCAWTAVSNANWITTTSSGSGNGTVNFAVAANTGAARTGTISVGGQTFTVSQAAASINVTVQTNPSGRAFTVDSTTYSTTQTFSWTSSSSHTISTTSPQSGTTGTQYVWSSWSDSGAISHTVAPTSNTTYSVNFTTQYFLTMNAGTGGIGTPSSGFFNSGQSVGISATPNANFSFSGWTGSGTGSFTGSNNPASVTMNGPITETSSFTAIPKTVQLSAPAYTINEGGGLVNITVTRSGDTSGTSTVAYATSNGTAKEGKDYVAAYGVLNFAAGETSRTFPVLIIDNAFVDGARTVNLALSNPTGATLSAPATAVLTINDNDVSTGANPIDQPRSFVQFHYYDFLSRYPDPSGWDFWTNQLTSCGSDASCMDLRRVNVSAAYFLSIEFQQTGYLVERIYKAAYGDAVGTSTLGGSHTLPVPIVRINEFLPDTQEIGQGVVVNQTGWETVLENNKQAFTTEYVQRARFTAAYPTSMTPTAFVDKLFANAGVTPLGTDRTAAINEFGSATTSADAGARGRVLRRVAENGTLAQQEFNRAFVLMQYFGYLRRNPNDPQDSDYTGFDFWLTKLNKFTQPGDDILVRVQKAEMVKAFIVSIEYRGRFGP